MLLQDLAAFLPWLSRLSQRSAYQQRTLMSDFTGDQPNNSSEILDFQELSWGSEVQSMAHSKILDQGRGS